MIKLDKSKLALLVILVSVIANIFLSFQLINVSPRFAKVDVELLITKLVKEASAKPFSEEESSKYTKEYISKLDDLLIQLSKQEHLIIVPSKAVIAGAIDIIDQVDELIRRKYAK